MENENTTYYIKKETLTNIADAIRDKLYILDKIKAEDFADKIKEIVTGGGGDIPQAIIDLINEINGEREDASILSNLVYLNTTKDLIKNAIISKDVIINDNDTFRSYENKIRQIINQPSIINSKDDNVIFFIAKEEPLFIKSEDLLIGDILFFEDDAVLKEDLSNNGTE